MKTKDLFSVLLTILFAFGLAACSNDDNETKEIKPLKFDKQSYETSPLGQRSIKVYNGSGKYRFEVQDADIIKITYTENEHFEEFVLGGDNSYLGTIHIQGLQTGQTKLTVTDEVTQDKAELAIKVTEPYLTFVVRDSNHPALNNQVVFFLIANEMHDCYFYYTNKPNPGMPVIPEVILESCGKGKYEFSVEKDGENSIPYLTLTYASDGKGQFTDAAIAPQMHKFNILGSSNSTYGIIQQYLNVDWDAMTEATLKNNIATFNLNMKEVDTAYEVRSELTTLLIPEGTLK